MEAYTAYLVDENTDEAVPLFTLDGTDAILALIEARHRLESIGGKLTPPYALDVRKYNMDPPNTKARREFLELPKAFGGVQRID
jgi:hypothetical protein